MNKLTAIFRSTSIHWLYTIMFSIWLFSEFSKNINCFNTSSSEKEDWLSESELDEMWNPARTHRLIKHLCRKVLCSFKGLLFHHKECMSPPHTNKWHCDICVCGCISSKQFSQRDGFIRLEMHFLHLLPNLL